MTIDQDTTDALSRIDHALGVQDAMPELDGEGWMPGDPLYDRNAQSVNCTRRMIQLVGTGEHSWARCVPCQVSWRGSDLCWVCGEQRPVGGFWPGPARIGAAPGAVVFDETHHFRTADLRPFLEVVRSGIRVLASSYARAARAVFRALTSATDHDEFSNPPPLCIDGREYRRRTRSRRRRSRRS